MDGGAHLAHALLEEAERVRVREHEPGDVRPKRRLERLEVDVPACVALHRRHLVAAHGCRRRVRPMGRVGHDDPTTLLRLAALRVIRLEHQERGELRLRASGRL